MALKSDGTVVGWGDNNHGQAIAPAGSSNVTAISAGQYHGLELRSDSTVIGWGDNGVAQATPPAGLAGVVAIAAGAYHSVALKSDGTVVSWGDNYFGEVTTPTGLAGVVAIAAGGFHSLALKSDGTVVGWGGQSIRGSNSACGVIECRGHRNGVLALFGFEKRWHGRRLGEQFLGCINAACRAGKRGGDGRGYL